jgi:hypothetical protein
MQTFDLSSIAFFVLAIYLFDLFLMLLLFLFICFISNYHSTAEQIYITSTTHIVLK